MDASDAKNTAIPPKSSGSPHLPTGVRSITLCSKSGISKRACLVNSVSIYQGKTALTWILLDAHVLAKLLVSCTTPP